MKIDMKIQKLINDTNYPLYFFLWIGKIFLQTNYKLNFFQEILFPSKKFYQFKNFKKNQNKRRIRRSSPISN